MASDLSRAGPVERDIEQMMNGLKHIQVENSHYGCSLIPATQSCLLYLALLRAMGMSSQVIAIISFISLFGVGKARRPVDGRAAELTYKSHLRPPFASCSIYVGKAKCSL
ncbi:hypothetical protein CCACVL1_03006 [Corchorus capsularis]|uniref:Uncharacterized protein n=1 Tax=Corchorus capsularis TaxID=210143 RepID=A0A1R3K3V4_COCAP|nr:hypothetical protein CCACVL1_03006 [Corchorus capsularis]